MCSKTSISFSKSRFLRPLEVYVISDGVPISRREICTAALQSKHFAGKEMPTFEVCEKLPSEGKGSDVFYTGFDGKIAFFVDAS